MGRAIRGGGGRPSPLEYSYPALERLSGRQSVPKSLRSMTGIVARGIEARLPLTFTARATLPAYNNQKIRGFAMADSFSSKGTLRVDGTNYTVYRLPAVYGKHPQ